MFELHAVQLELEAVEKQIQDLLVKQAELRERQTALETSRADAHQSSGLSTQNAFNVHSGAVTPGTLGSSAAEGASQASDQDLSPSAVFEVSTRNSFSPLCKAEHDAVVIGDSIVRHVHATTTKGKGRSHCFPGAHVLDDASQVPTILNGDESIRAVVLHAGVNDTRLRQTEVLKQDFRSLIETVRATSPATRIIMSGLLPTYRRGHERSDLGSSMLMACTPAESELIFCCISKMLRTI